MQLQDTTERPQTQSEIIKAALLYLSGQCDGAATRDGQGFNGADSDFGKNLATAAKNWGLSYPQEYAANKMLRKYWRQLRKAGIELPKPFVNHYSIAIHNDEIATVTNDSKASQYQVTRDGFGDLSCECEAFTNGNQCGHVKFAEDNWPQVEAELMEDEWIDDSDPHNAMLQVMGWTAAEIRAGKRDTEREKRWEDADWHIRQLDTFYELEAITDDQYKQLNDAWVAYGEGAGPMPSDDYDIKIPGEPTDTGLEILPGITATEGQAKALNELIEFANGGNSLHLLAGFAGTGKTMLLQAWIKRLRDSGDRRSIVFTAPTNKAAEVLRSMVTKWGLSVECVTCAKLLGLRPVINRETGKEEFKKNYAEDSAIQEYDIVVADECSMVSADLFVYLSEEANILTKILFVGDSAQLPPVGEAISDVFTKVAQQSLLTEVKRYSGSIALVADDLRRHLGRRGEPLIESSYSEDGTQGVFVLAAESWRKNMIKAFKSEKSQENPDYCRVLAWRNKTVNGLNSFIRDELLGVGADRFVVGERLLALDYFAIKDATGRPKTLFNTSAEMEVLDAFEGRQGEWAVWFLRVVMLDSEGLTYTVPVLHESELKRFEQAQAKIKQSALKGERHRWDNFYENRKAFAWVDYAYAMTVHKSQGSTFANVFVDMGDIMANTTKATIEGQPCYERNQLLYVAMARASDRVFIQE